MQQPVSRFPHLTAGGEVVSWRCLSLSTRTLGPHTVGTLDNTACCWWDIKKKFNSDKFPSAFFSVRFFFNEWIPVLGYMFLFRTETKRVGGSALRRQEYGEYPGENSQVFQERRQKSDQSSLRIWQRARSGRVCSAVELSDLRREHLKSRQNVSFSSVWPRSEQRRYSRSERIYESSAIGGAGGRGWDFGQRQPEFSVASPLVTTIVSYCALPKASSILCARSIYLQRLRGG